MLAGTMLLTGCSEDSAVSQRGGIAVKVDIDSRVIDGSESRGSVGDLLGAITPDQLKVKLDHESGKHSFSYDSFDALPTTYEFPIGNYTVTAYYGDVETEGVDKPALEGTTTIEVRENRDTPVNLTAKLANCIVEVDYTDNFKEYMSNYYSQLNSSSGYTYNIPEKEDDGCLFFKPGSTSVTVNFVKPDGNSGQYTISQFDAKAQHLYKVTFDLDSRSGLLLLNITFNDKTIAEIEPIDLSKDIDVIPAPYLIARGFDPKQTAPIDFIESLPYNEELDIQVVAMGGLQSVTLATVSCALCNEPTNDQLFPKEIELIGASEADKALLRSYGLEVSGLWVNPDQMGIIDFGSVLKSIRYFKDEQTTFTVVATDRFGRKSDPMTLRLNPIELSLTLTSTNGTEFELGMYEEVAHVHVQYNGGLQFADQLRFEYADANGNWIPTTVTGIQQTPSSTNPGNDKYRLCAFVKVPSGHENVKIHAHCGEKVSNDVEFKRVGSFMYFNQFYDEAGLNTFATSAKVELNIGAIDRNSIEIYARKKGEGDDAWVKKTSTTVPAGSTAPIITVTGLEPDTEYEFEARGKSTMPDQTDVVLTTEKPVAVHTERALQIEGENNDKIARFEDWEEIGAFSDKTAWVGQNYIARWFVGSQAKQTWQTRNPLTTGQSNGATCFYTSLSSTVPVTGSGNTGRAAEISVVGYGEGTTFIATSSGREGSPNRRASGMLFLGNYSANGEDPANEVIDEGVAFGSRPAGLKFNYKFAPKNNEYCRVYIAVENRDGAEPVVIAEKEFTTNQAVNDWTSKEISLEYKDSSLKATHIKVTFRASTATTPKVYTVRGSVGGFNGYSDSKYIGNVLTVDDIELIY